MWGEKVPGQVKVRQLNDSLLFLEISLRSFSRMFVPLSQSLSLHLRDTLRRTPCEGLQHCSFFRHQPQALTRCVAFHDGHGKFHGTQWLLGGCCRLWHYLLCKFCHSCLETCTNLEQGVAFAYRKPGAVSSMDEIEVIKDWPGANGITSDKVPTEIAYDGIEIHWGFLIEEQDRRIRCIKLFLDGALEMPSFVSARDVEEQLSLASKRVTECARDYLKKLHEFTMDVLNRRFSEAFVCSKH